MESEMFSLSSIKSMEVIELNTGAKLGYILDFKIDCEENKVQSILLPSLKVGWFSKKECIEIPWSNIAKIGVDVIIVNSINIANNIDD
ncbi:MAG TPA: YlmC/YmxH family sporulation protein [Clostridiaceae bacterium]